MYFNLDDTDIEIIYQKKFADKIVFKYEGNNYYYKRSKSIERHYNEIIAYEIAKKVGINSVPYMLATCDDGIGVISEMFDTNNFISMDDYLKEAYQTNKPFRYNNFACIWNAFSKDFDSDTVKKLMNQLVDIFIFDALIGNIDRHTENYGLIINDKQVNFAPLFDNENMLSTDSIYYGDYSIGIEPGEFNTIYGNIIASENLLYKFLDKSDDSYKERLKEKLDSISEESILEILERIENAYTKISPYVKKSILNKFADNRRMIEKYFLSKEKTTPKTKKKRWFK